MANVIARIEEPTNDSDEAACHERPSHPGHLARDSVAKPMTTEGIMAEIAGVP